MVRVGDVQRLLQEALPSLVPAPTLPREACAICSGIPLRVEEGHFCYAGTQPRETLTAGQVQAVLDDRRYSWLRWT